MLQVGFYALLGAASFLGGLMRMSAAQALILMEMTQAPAQLPFLMLVSVGYNSGFSRFVRQMLPGLGPSSSTEQIKVPYSVCIPVYVCAFVRVDSISHVHRPCAQNPFISRAAKYGLKTSLLPPMNVTGTLYGYLLVSGTSDLKERW